MNQMREQLQKQLDTLMKAVPNLAVQTSITQARQITSTAHMEDNYLHSTQSTSPSSQSDNSGSTVNSPEKK